MTCYLQKRSTKMQTKASVGAPLQLPEFNRPLRAVTSQKSPCCQEVSSERSYQILPGMVGYVSITSHEIQVDNGVESEVRFCVDNNLNFRITSDHCPQPTNPVIRISDVAYYGLQFYFVNSDFLHIWAASTATAYLYTRFRAGCF